MRGRVLVCVALAVAVVAGVVPTPGGGVPPARALDLSDCHDFGDGFARGYPAAVDDGQVVSGTAIVYRYRTRWNAPLAVPQGGGVLMNDFDGEGSALVSDVDDPALRDLAGLAAILTRQTQYGTVTLHQDGSFTYVPNLTALGPSADRVVDTFQYVGLQTHTGKCSDPGTVSIEVDGFDEPVDLAPTANADAFPTDRAAISADDVLTIPAPGVLANDFNGVSLAPNDNLEARLLSQPYWKGTTLSAGTITGWGVRDTSAGPITDNSGGFVFTPSRELAYGTAEFRYMTCYVVRPTTATACSEPTTASIEVALTTVARPMSMFVQSGFGFLAVADVRGHTTFNAGPRPRLELGTTDHGTMQLIGNDQTGMLLYQAGASFTGQDQSQYRYCSVTTPTICSNWAAITIAAAPPNPHVASVTFPDAADQPVIVTFSEQVSGIADNTVTLYDTTNGVPVAVPALLQCRSVFLPGSTIGCNDLSLADTVLLRPLAPLTAGHDYNLRINTEDQGIVATVDPHPPLAPYQELHRFELAPADRDDPVAAPTQSPAPNAAGWNRSAVTVDWHWTDGTGSGIDPAQCPQTSTATGDGAPGTAVGSCTDLAGNTAVATYDAKIDTTGPVASPTPTSNGSSWSKDDVTIAWHWSDAFGSGIDPAHCSQTSTSSGEGMFIIAAGCTDLAGNFSLAQYNVNVDKTGPVAAPILAPAANAAGWNRGDVTVDWHWTDGTGSGIDPSKCTTARTSSTEGTLILSAACTDLAGNTTVASTNVKVDRTGPVAAPTQAAAGNGRTLVTWNWSDGTGSGIDPSKCPSTSTSGPAAPTVSATCTDRAGNTSTASSGMDRAAPVASPTQQPPPNAAGWSTSTVTISWNWSDGTGSGIDPARCTATSTSSGQGTASLRASCADRAGNTRTEARKVKVDTSAPTLAPRIATNPVLLGSRTKARPGATDRLSGVASASCGALDTSTVGAKSVVCTATDRAGNVRSVSVPYVVTFRIGHVTPQPRAKVARGSTVPVTFRFTLANGQPIAAGAAPSLPPCAATVTLGTLAPVCAQFDGRAFLATLTVPGTTPVGTTLTIRVTVVIGTATIATKSTSVRVTR